MLGGHESVNHSIGEYVSASDPELHNNTAESVFALLKRGLYGTFHSCTVKHLHRYLAEFEYRWNARHVRDPERLDMLMLDMNHKRLPYRQQTWGVVGLA